MQSDTTENDVRNNNVVYMKNLDASSRNPKRKKRFVYNIYEEKSNLNRMEFSI